MKAKKIVQSTSGISKSLIRELLPKDKFILVVLIASFWSRNTLQISSVKKTTTPYKVMVPSRNEFRSNPTLSNNIEDPM